MAHNVSAKMKDVSLGNAGSSISMTIAGDDGIIGHIELGKGSFRWRFRKERATSNRVMSWKQFFAFLETYDEK